MTKAILSVGALLAAAVALAGCGGGGSSASGTVNTGAGVAGAHHTKANGSFNANVHGFAARLQTSVKAFENGNVSAAASSGGSLLAHCTSTVNDKLAPNATTSAQRKAVAHLRVSCSDMYKAVNSGSSGNMMKAKEFARSAAQQAQIAAKLSG